MATIRAINRQNERLATGRTMKDGSFLQFYPRHLSFVSEDLWVHTLQSQDQTIHFTTSGRILKSDPADKTRRAYLEAHLAPQDILTNGPLTDPGPVVRPWQYVSKDNHTFNAGTYYIGDPSNFLPQLIHDNILSENNCQSGYYTVVQQPSQAFLVARTGHGKGIHQDRRGRQYSTQSGLLGICTQTLVDKESPTLAHGHQMTFTDPVQCIFRNGVFLFKMNGRKKIEINTQGSQ